MLQQTSTVLRVATDGRGFTDLTRMLADWLAGAGIEEGLLSLLCLHTSASLLIQENAARAVRTDLAAWLDRIAPESTDYGHDDEGPDDMPAHLKATLTGVTLGIPVRRGRMLLGTWQAVYLAEHRRAGHQREIAVHLIGQ